MVVGWDGVASHRGQEPPHAALPRHDGSGVRRTARCRCARRVAHISEAHFSRQFRATFGEPPHCYLRRRRVERAMELLRETEHCVTEICFDVGFNSLGTFSRTFTSSSARPSRSRAPSGRHERSCTYAKPDPTKRAGRRMAMRETRLGCGATVVLDLSPWFRVRGRRPLTWRSPRPRLAEPRGGHGVEEGGMPLRAGRAR